MLQVAMPTPGLLRALDCVLTRTCWTATGGYMEGTWPTTQTFTAFFNLEWQLSRGCWRLWPRRLTMLKGLHLTQAVHGLRVRAVECGVCSGGLDNRCRHAWGPLLCLFVGALVKCGMRCVRWSAGEVLEALDTFHGIKIKNAQTTLRCTYACMHVWLWALMSPCVGMCVCMYVMYVCMHAYMHVCLYVCTYVCMPCP